MGVKSWTMELKDEVYSIGLAFMWKKQQECNLRYMIRIMKDTCNDIKKQNSLAQFSEKSSLTLYRELNFLCTNVHTMFHENWPTDS
jgi:hypothetical protein